MALGPFISYVPPGVYTRTLTEANVSNLVAGLRIPVVIGVGQETLEVDDVELVRGSSATVDEQIINEDVTEEWVVNATNPQNLQLGVQTGLLVTFKVANNPLVNGQGTGTITNDTKTVTVTVNGTPVAVAQVQGTQGLITLQVPTQPTDTVRVTYYFHRGDTSFTDTLTPQVTTTPAILQSPGVEPFVVTAGTNDTFVLTVSGVQSTITFLAGTYTALAMTSAINSAGVANLVASVYTDNDGMNHIQLLTTQNLLIGSGNANGLFGFSVGQQTTRNQNFQVYNIPVVDGSGGGVTTTDTSKVVAKVNGVQVIPTSLDGTNGVVTLPFAPAAGSTVTIQYFSNTWQNTFDYLPNSLVTQVIQCGISPTRNDYVQGTDFIVSNPTSSISIILWGTSFVVAAGTTTPGAQPFDDTLVSGLLIDDKLWLAPCARVVDTSTIPATVSPNQFLLPEVPTTGNGRDTPLGQATFTSVTNGRQDLVTNRPDLVTVRVGRSFLDALNRPAAVVTAVDGATRTVTLRDALPPDFGAYATFWYNRITDDTFVMTCTVPGALGTGQFTILDSANNQPLYSIYFGGKGGLSQIVQWPRGVETIPDAFFTGSGTPVSEVVTVTFGNTAASNASYTNRLPEPYSFYTPYSATWTTQINGSSLVTNLAASAKGVIVSGHVTPIQSGVDAGKIIIPASPGNVLNIVIDGTAVQAVLTPGNETAASLVATINAAIDAATPFTGTAPNLLCSYVQIGGAGTGDILFIIKSYTAPGALPAGFDSPSAVSIAQGTVETVLGFKTFQTAKGTSGAINKPATMLGSVPGPFNITTGVNDTLLVTVNGVQYTVVLPSGSAVATSSVVTTINATPGLTGVASVGTLANINLLRLMSPTNTVGSSILIGAGSANQPLGFVQNQSASQTQVTAQEVVDELMATVGFTTGAVAYADNINARNYITFESILTGAASSSIGFVNSANSAFNTSTNIGLTPGTDGDNGEDPINKFVVTSTNPSGSAGTGYPGQTYVDATTGLRFTVLPSQTGTYDVAGHFSLTVSQTFNVSSSTPFYGIPGLESTVANTVGVAVNDTGTVQTFNPSGITPAIGDFYFVSYDYMKQDFTTTLYQQQTTIEANFGPVSPTNRVSLAAYLAILNGAVLVGISQVLKIPNTNQASDQSFITAIQALATPLPGNVKPDILVPLATSTAVYAYLTQHCEVQSNIRNQAERLGFIGFASGTTPSNAQSVAKSLLSNRIIAFYPDSSDITLTDETGAAYESLIDGTFFAAAVAGAGCSPSVDVATPYDRRRLQGFTDIPRILDPVTANQTAVAGVTLLEQIQPLIRIRQALTTNMASILTRLPTVTQISDFVQQQSRAILDSFVGTKFLASRTNEVVVTMTALLKGLIQAEIIGAYTGVTADVSADDPTVLLFNAYYQPIFPLLYLVLTFNLRASL
jgi:hypothetical protein